MKTLHSSDLFNGIEEYTPFKEDVVVWIGLRAGDYKSIDFAYPNGIASTRFGKDTFDIVKDFDFVSVEQHTETRTDSDMDELNTYLENFLSKFSGQRVHLVCYHSTSFLERIVERFPNIHILNPPSSLKLKLDKKSYVYEEMKRAGIRVIPGHIAEMKESNFEDIVKLYGLPFFVQFDDAASGSGSFLIEDNNQFRCLTESNCDKTGTFMKFIEGRSLNMNVVRTHNYTVLSEPSFQIIGNSECTIRRFGYCGNDFNIESKVSDEEISQMKGIALKVGDWIGDKGYRGLFGIDFISDRESVYFTEINPRFQGSTALLTDQQIKRGKIPISMFHLVPYLEGINIEPEFLEKYNNLGEFLSASQILVHNLSKKDVLLKSSLMPGRYSFSNGRLKYRGEGHFLSETRSSDEIVLAGDIPFNGTRILRDSDEICRIYTEKEVLDSNGKNLNRFGIDVVNAVSGGLVLI